jgi:hypothetical protein
VTFAALDLKTRSKSPFDKLRAGSFDKLRAGSFDKLRAGSFDKLNAVEPLRVISR